MTSTLSHPETIRSAMPIVESSRGPNLPASQDHRYAQTVPAGRDQTSPSTKIICALSNEHSPAGTQTTEGQRVDAAHPHPALGSSSASHASPDTQGSPARGSNFTSGQTVNAPPVALAAGGSTSDRCQTVHGAHVLNAPVGSNVGNSHATRGTHFTAAVADQATPPSQEECEAQTSTAGRGPILRDGLLAIMADAVDDLERTRIANENRYRQLTRVETDSDGEERGFGLTDSVIEVKRVHDIVDGLAALEHQAILAMQSQVRKHPLWRTWASEQKGIGQKQFARLLAAVGDPYWNDLHDRPRIVSELWAYCGYHVVHPGGQLGAATQSPTAAGVAPKRQRGQKSNWSETARMRVWNITGSCLKAQGHYATVYYKARDKYENAMHPAPCVRCGPKGKPAPEGSPLSAAHQHARGLRIMGKEILLDLWLAARELHN